MNQVNHRAGWTLLVASIAAFMTSLDTMVVTTALPTLRAATDPSVQGGQYWGPDGFREMRGYPVLATSSKQARDIAVQERLWKVSEELTGVTYPV